MRSPLSVPPRPELAVPPSPRFKLLGRRVGGPRSLWAWPLLLSLVFVAGGPGWMIPPAVDEQETPRAGPIPDPLPLQSPPHGPPGAEAARPAPPAAGIKH